MGSCVSATRHSDSAMKLNLSLGSKSDKLVTPLSPLKHPNGDCTVGQLVLKSPWSPPRSGHGSKDETFFDSKVCLDSDCEDDFYSVNGDFTPSRGNTPVHHKFSMGQPRVLSGDKIPSSNSNSEPSPTEKKKKLVDLFRERIRDDHDGDAHSTPDIPGAASVCSSKRAADEEATVEKDKAMKSMQCCLPSLVAYRSFSERRKKSPVPSPAIAVDDKH